MPPSFRDEDPDDERAPWTSCPTPSSTRRSPKSTRRPPRSPLCGPAHHQRRYGGCLVGMVVLAVGCWTVLLLDREGSIWTLASATQRVRVPSPEKDRSSRTAAPAQADSVTDNITLDAIRDLRGRVEAAKQDMIQAGHGLYGAETYYAMFQTPVVVEDASTIKDNSETTTTTRHNVTQSTAAFVQPATQPSYDRFVRQLAIKVLLQQQQQQQHQSHTTPNTQFVWASGGHSSSAAHGNYFHESYHAVLARAVAPVAEALQWTFVTRNFGMSAAESGPELALCQESVYGRHEHTDVLVWDFGQVDGTGEAWRQQLYTRRTGILERTPTDKSAAAPPMVLALHLNEGRNSRQMAVVEEATADGMAVLGMKESAMKVIHQAIPEMMGLTEEQIQATPSMVRSFKCENRLELGDPYCLDERWSKGDCPNRHYKVSWHPGYKTHAVSGTALSLFWTDAVLEALSVLESHAPYRPRELVQQLQAAQAADMVRAASTALPVTPEMTARFQTTFPDVPPSRLYQQRSFCRIARLPSQMRREGWLTGRTADDFDHWYREGTERMTVEQNGPPNSTYVVPGNMHLVYDERMRQSCVTPVNIDYTDYFHFGTDLPDGALTFTIPSPREQEEYNWSSSSSIANEKHMIVLCVYDAKRLNIAARRNEISADTILQGNASDPSVLFTVNSKRAVARTFLKTPCLALEADDESHFFEPKVDGTFDISIQIVTNQTKTWILQLSSVILL